MKTQLWLDSCAPDAVQKWCVELGICKGITTNPGIVKRDLAPGESFLDRLRALPRGLTVSVQLGPQDEPYETLYEYGLALTSCEMLVKVPVTNLKLIRELSQKKLLVNATAVMSVSQGLLATAAGAAYVSVFWNRIKDDGGHPGDVVHDLGRSIGLESIIVGSIRSSANVYYAAYGAGVVTVPPSILEGMVNHPATDKVMKEWGY